MVRHIKAGKVDVATIHDVDGSGFRQEHIEGMNVVQLAIRDVDKTRNVAPQVMTQRVHLHRRLGECRKCAFHGKTDNAQSDGRRVQGVDGIGQVQPQFFGRTYSVLAWVMSRWANAAWIRQSAPFVGIQASVERRKTGWRKPM